MISPFSQFKHKCSPFHEDLSSFSWGCFFFSVFSRLFSPIHSNSLKTSTVRTPPMKPNNVLKNNSSGENISQSLRLIGNQWNILWTPLEVFSLRNWEAVLVLAVSAFYREMYEKLTCKVRFRQVVENDVLLPPWMGYNKTNPSPLQLKTMSGERTKNLEDWTKTVIKSLIKYDGANCYNNFWKQFSFKERITEKDVKNFMTDRFSILALLLALYLLSWFYSLTRKIFYTI